MIILSGLRRLLVVTGIGYGANADQLCWLNIDSSPLVLETDPQTASDLANADGDSFFITDQIGARLGVGQFSGSEIVFNPVSSGAITWTGTTQSFTPMRIASCKRKPTNAYCLGYVGNSQRPFVIRTQDGGKSWTECNYVEPNLTNPASTFSSALDAFDPFVKSPYSIAVHPTDPLTVAVGYGAAALSNDGGTGQWLALNNAGATPAVPIHGDVHKLCFDDTTNTLVVPSDGGLLSLPSLASLINPPLPFSLSARYFPGDTRRNRTLPVLLLEGYPQRQSLGNVAIAGGIVVTGTQDNANLWLDPSSQVWGALEVKAGPVPGTLVATGGDGGVVAVSAQASGMYVLHGQNAASDNVPVQWARWQGGSWSSSATVPAPGSTTGLIPIMRPVSSAVGLFAMLLGPSPVMAVASPANNVVFGAVVLAIPRIPPAVVWVQLGTVPTPEVITALEAFDASSVLVGTQSGRLFRISLNGSWSEIFFDDNVTGPVTGVASDGNTVVCFNSTGLKKLGAVGRFVYAGQPISATGSPQGLSRISTAAFPPNTGARFFRSISANRNSTFLRLTFAIAVDENEVWVSNSPLAAVWHKAVDGLPTAVRCSDLVFSEAYAEGQLFLSTYGRGLWKLAF